MRAELKKEVLRLLKEDAEFRYAVAGFIGLDEILKRLDRNEAELVKIGEELVKLREDMNGLREDMNKLREDMIQGFKRHDEILEKHSTEIARLREDMIQGFKRHDEILEKHSIEIARLREDTNRGLELLERRLSALGARWGMMTEEAFREGLKGLLEKELKLKVERWESYDDEGLVYGYPSQVEVDIALHDERITLIEVTSHAEASDAYEFKRKSILYEKKTGKKPSRLLMVTPYADYKAIEASKKLGVEVYTKV